MSSDKSSASLLELLDELTPVVDQNSLNRVRYFVEYNEIKLSLELLCEYIYDDDVSLEDNHINRINEFCEVFKVDKNYWLDTNNQRRKDS